MNQVRVVFVRGLTAVKRLALVGVAAGGVLALPAHAAPIDVSGVVTAIGDTAGPVGLIGSAVLLVIVAIAAFKWVRRALA